MIRKKDKSSLSLKKEELELLRGCNVMILKKRGYLYIFTEEEFQGMIKKIKESLVGSERRNFYRYFLSKTYQKKIKNRKIKIPILREL